MGKSKLGEDYREFEVEYIGCTFVFPKLVSNYHGLKGSEGLDCVILEAERMEGEADEEEQIELKRIIGKRYLVDVEDRPNIGISGGFNPSIKLYGDWRLRLRIENIV